MSNHTASHLHSHAHGAPLTQPRARGATCTATHTGRHKLIKHHQASSWTSIGQQAHSEALIDLRWYTSMEGVTAPCCRKALSVCRVCLSGRSICGQSVCVPVCVRTCLCLGLSVGQSLSARNIERQCCSGMITGAGSRINGSVLAANSDIVVVTINYRLGEYSHPTAARLLRLDIVISKSYIRAYCHQNCVMVSTRRELQPSTECNHQLNASIN